MKQEISPITNIPSLEEIKDQFQHWRKTRKKRTTIPNHLWQSAIELSKDYSINIISKALRLNYNDFKKRIKEAGIKYQDKQDVKPDFVQVNIGGEISREYIVEMENPNGNRMKIHFKGGIGSDLLELARVFWGMRQ